MPDDGGLRVGPWPPDPDDAAGQPSTAGAEATPRRREWWEDMPDPWDRLPDPADDFDTAEQPALDGHGRRGRRGRPPHKDAALRRAALLVVVVGALMVGTGALANLLEPEPTAFPAPPTPPENLLTTAPQVDSRLGDAPSPTPSRGRPVTVPPADTTAPSRAPTSAPAPTPTATPTVTGGPTGGITDTGELSFEAEQAEIGGLANSYPTDAASGGRAVQLIGMWGLNYVRFPEVTVAEAGEHTVTFHYLGTRDLAARISVNDGPAVTVDFPGLADPDRVGTVQVTLELAAGQNSIWFGGSGFAGPDLDRITVAA